MSKQPWWLAVFVCALVCASASHAQAALKLCNRTSYVVYAATAYASNADAVTQGWTRIVPGSCRIAIVHDLDAQDYYVYARSSLAHSGASRAWGGDTPFCVKDTNFAANTPLAVRRCPSDDLFDLPFARVNTHRMKSWTMTFSETPDIGSMSDATRAGLKRLLKDNGAAIGAIDARPEKSADDAIASFRKRLRLAANAGASDLFDALETEALKAGAPAGYAVCNDTADTIWVAIAQKTGTVWVARGWWKVATGGCAKIITEALATDKIYLLAQKPAGAPLVTGPAKFCVTNIEFEIQGRTRCAERGLVEAGFAETNVKGLGGFAAHVGDSRLVTPFVSHTGTSK
jgi:uncharacterized membrane protein